MGRHSFSAVWSAPQRYRSRRPAVVAIGVASLVIILVVSAMIWFNTAPPAPESRASTTTTATSTEIAESSTSATATTSAPAALVVLPVWVLNNSSVNGLAARVAAVLEANGWPIADLRNYSETQVPATTAFFTPGVAAEEAAARAMVAQFPQIAGGAEPRFAGLDGTGLTLAAVGDWLP